MSISNKKQHGFSMIEVLVSLVVIGVGLLGITGLQLASVKGAGNAHFRNVASLMAMDISDRMRSNREGVAGDFYDNNVSCATIEATQCNSSTAFCTPEETARYDVQEVMCGVTKGSEREGGIENSLLSGALTIENIAAIGAGTKCSDLDSPTTHRITVAWSNKKLDNDQADAVRNQSLQICVIP